jgi:antitoxin (DNA-binding transcriptional repressor) of toxin-antitoxin stability system
MPSRETQAVLIGRLGTPPAEIFNWSTTPLLVKHNLFCIVAVATKWWHNSYMVQLGLKDAKNKLSELFTMALLGETVVITRQGENQSIRLVPIPPPHPDSGFGMLRSQLADLPHDWNDPDTENEFLEQFEAFGE